MGNRGIGRGGGKEGAEETRGGGKGGAEETKD